MLNVTCNTVAEKSMENISWKNEYRGQIALFPGR